MQSQFLAAINQRDEKNLPKDVVMETVKAALRAAYRKTTAVVIKLWMLIWTKIRQYHGFVGCCKENWNSDQQMTVAELNKRPGGWKYCKLTLHRSVTDESPRNPQKQVISKDQKLNVVDVSNI